MPLLLLSRRIPQRNGIGPTRQYFTMENRVCVYVLFYTLTDRSHTRAGMKKKIPAPP